VKPEMKPAIMIGVLLCGVSSVEAHCYRQWYYPWPQDCGTRHRTYIHPATFVRFVPPLPPTSPKDIPLPDMSAQWGGSMDTELELSLQRLKALRQLTQEGN
jgi:hypothetical protein